MVSGRGFPSGSVVKDLPVDAGDMGSIPGWGRAPGEGNGNPLQCSYLGDSVGRGAWCAADHGVRVGHSVALNTSTHTSRAGVRA